MDEHAKWKRRFHLFMAVRLAGLVVLVAGVAVMFTSVVREGGWPAAGIVLAIAGLAAAVAGPRLLKRQWDREDAQ